MRKRLIPISLLIASMALGTFVYYRYDGMYYADAPPAGGDFSLTRHGSSVSLSDYEGQAVVLYFGFTACPDACPTMLSKLGKIRKEIDGFKIIFISVDPDRDDQKKIDDYVGFFHPSITALRGNEDQVRLIARNFGVNFSKHFPQKDSQNYTVDHTTYAILVGKDGKIQEYIPAEASVEEIHSIISRHI